MPSRPRFLQGVFPFTGVGLDKSAPLADGLVYVVPDGAVGQVVYLRAGNSSPELLLLSLVRDGEPMRLFPVAARGDVHVPLRVVEDLPAGTVLSIDVAAPDGVEGSAVVDLGLVEV